MSLGGAGGALGRAGMDSCQLSWWKVLVAKIQAQCSKISKNPPQTRPAPSQQHAASRADF